MEIRPYCSSRQISPDLPPVADAGADQSVTVGSVVTLSGSASHDPDNQPLTCRWSFLDFSDHPFDPGAFDPAGVVP
jgi:hypothetical protein